ncbi:MAG: AI-2E family transporter [Chloroflexi bacterium]|nr:AI-2E family transporter [Chloroflexota bacterium]
MVIRDPWIRALVITMLLIAGFYLAGIVLSIAGQVADVLLLFFLAWVVSFILEPLVVLLELRPGLPRRVAVMVVYAALLVVASVAIVRFVPPLSVQIIQLANDLPSAAQEINAYLLYAQAVAADHGVTVTADSLLSTQEAIRHVESIGPLLLSNAVLIATGVANLLFRVFIIVILSYYVTLDGQKITGSMLQALPSDKRDDLRFFFATVNRSFGGFLRGQLVQAIIYALGTAAVMLFFKLDFVLLSAVLAGISMLIPFIGPLLALAAPLLVSLTTRLETLLFVFIALFVLQQIVVNVIAPRVMSQTIGLHPLLVFFAFLAGANLAGVWGAVFGVPVVGVLVAMVSFYRAALDEKHRASREAAVAALRQAEATTGTDSEPPVTPTLQKEGTYP